MKKKQEDFFLGISTRCGQDPAIVRMVYYAMVKEITSRLRDWGEVLLPDLGVFSITIHEARRSRNVNTDQIFVVPDRRTLKFRPWYNLKAYIKSLDDKKIDSS